VSSRAPSMVLTCKVFVADHDLPLEEVAIKLKDFRITSEHEEEGQRIELVNEVKNLGLQADILRGIYCFDLPVFLKIRGERRLVPRTFDAFFEFLPYRGRLFLLVYEKKERANSVANKLSKIVFLSPGKILAVKIPPENLRKYHEERMEDSKVVFFDNVDFPNIEKLSLYGFALLETSLYYEYLKHGNIWYVVVRSRKFGYVVGVARNGIIVSFTKVDIPQLSEFVREEILPLVSS